MQLTKTSEIQSQRGKRCTIELCITSFSCRGIANSGLSWGSRVGLCAEPLLGRDSQEGHWPLCGSGASWNLEGPQTYTSSNSRIYAHMFTKINYLLDYKESLEILKDWNSSSDVPGPSEPEQAQGRLSLGPRYPQHHRTLPSSSDQDSWRQWRRRRAH